MNFDYRIVDRSYSIGYGKGCMGVGTGIQYDAAVLLVESAFLYAVDYFTFSVALTTLDLDSVEL